MGDVLIELGINAGRAQVWSQKYTAFEQALWHSGLPYPKLLWRDWIGWLRGSTIAWYNELKTEKMAGGVDPTTAMHESADQAVNELKHRTRQKRRIERDILLGIGGHEELLRRYRGNAKLTDAHSRRIAKKLFQVSRWAVMERALTEVGFPPAEVREKMEALMGAFKKSDESGQSQWKKTREAVLRRSAEADAMALAEQAEARTIKGYARQRRKTSPLVAQWVERNYGEIGGASEVKRPG